MAMGIYWVLSLTIVEKKKMDMSTAEAVHTDENFSKLPASAVNINAIHPKEAFDLYQK